MTDRCIFCSKIVPEGRQVCKACELSLTDAKRCKYCGSLISGDADCCVFCMLVACNKGQEGKSCLISK